MHFIINTKTFLKHVTLAADIAIKNTEKYHSNAGMINISAWPKILQIDAFGGSASITVKVRESDGYEYEDMGQVCIKAKQLISDLKSFLHQEKLDVYIKDGKLKLSPPSDIYNYLKIPICSNYMHCPESPEEYEQELTVDREYFVKGLKQVQYAPDTEEILYNYMCIFVESYHNTLKFTAGDGSRFAVIEYIGNNKVISSGDAKMFFPNTNTSNIISAFDKADSSTLCIKTSAGNPIENIPEQYTLETDNVVVRIYGTEHFIKYPDVDKTVNYNYTYQIPTNFQDWKYVAEAIAASKHSLIENIHNTKIMTDLEHGHFDIQTNTLMGMNRKVYFEPEACVISDSQENSDKPWFRCNAYFLIEMAKKNKKKETIIFNFEDQAKLDGLSVEEKRKIMKPVLLKFPDEIDKCGVTETSLILFSISTKWDDKYLSQEQEGIESRSEILDL